MKEFKFLHRPILETDFRPEIIDRIYLMCKEALDHRKDCERVFLLNNPQIDPAYDHYSFPIEHIEIKTEYPEGTLWHCTQDLDEEMDIVYHTLFLDPYDGDEYYYFTVHQNEDESLFIYDIGKDTNSDLIDV